jgi:hypothetical protein
MPKTPKVVPIAEEKYKVIARDTKAHRVIIGIGAERFAFDLFSRISKLPPQTGDQPATVLPMNKRNVTTKKGRVTGG